MYEVSDRPRPEIDPALGLDLTAARTLTERPATVSVVIPAHNERDTISEIITEAQRGLDLLGATGEVIVSASGCTDDTEQIATRAGARVITAPLGKGAAVKAGIAVTNGEVICLIDGDMRYFGKEPLVVILVGPILRGTADACISDLYWRPLYPQLWLNGFFTPLAGAIFPELLSKAGSTPWSGQRAAVRTLWPQALPDGFTMDLELLLYWNLHAVRLRPILADDWMNPQRPKPDLMEQEFRLIVQHGLNDGRMTPESEIGLKQWFDAAHRMMANYQPGRDDPADFERQLLQDSLAELRKQLNR
jgi:hypothetical protein